MRRRIIAKESFVEIEDAVVKVKWYFKRDEICPGEDKTLYNDVFQNLLDIGDIIGVAGKLYKTQTGELSVMVEKFTVLSKSLRPLPIVKTDKDGKEHHAFTDAEQRYRQRYVDLIVNKIGRASCRERV